MRSLLPLFLVASLVLGVAAEKLPEKFYGKYTLDHSENFDEYLQAKGYGFFTRKLIVFATFEKIFAKAEGDKFNYENLTSKKNVAYPNIVLGSEFTGEGLDSTQHKVTFYMKGGKLYEKHVPVEITSESKPEEYVYHFDDQNFLVVTMEAEGVIGKRFYKRV